MKKILVLGAGLVAKPLVQYLLNQDDIQVMVASRTVSKAEKLVDGHVKGSTMSLNVNDTDALKEFVKTVCNKYRLPYFTISPTFSVCPSCGYLPGENTLCPKCNDECEVYSRVVGYLRPVKQWNNGKKEEFITRKTYCVCK